MERLFRFIYDFKYILLNCFVRHIPSWYIRKIFYVFMGMKIGKKSRIGINTIVVEPKNIVIGERSIINENCYLDGRGGLKIGNNASISFETTIITTTHDTGDTFKCITESTIIKNNVWIGNNVIILNGSVIENLCVIGAGCVFKCTTEEKGIYVGNPARKIKSRECLGEYKINYKPFFR